MSKIVKKKKPIILKFEDKEINLPEDIKLNIEKFWNNAVKENPSLYNGKEFAVETVSETEECIKMTVIKSTYAHYLYDERIGIKEEKYKCYSPWGGILIITKDNYIVVGEMNENMSVPYCLQISGGGIDELDIKDGKVDIISNIKRELKEELNLNLEDISYKVEFMEYPTKTRNAYGFLAVGKIPMTKDELNEHFKEYVEYLIKNNLEIEFKSLKFFEKENALEEFDKLKNPKRSYLRDLIKETIKY